jgi:AcrR family transcriptional regulator
MQRARLLGAAVAVVDELGWSQVTVASIASRARVSRKTFYEMFSGIEDCLLAVLQDTLVRIEEELAAAAGSSPRGLSWRERMRSGLWVVLSFFDREPELARLCIVASPSGGRRVQEWRVGVIARLTAIVAEGRPRGAGARRVPELTAEGTVGAVLAILYTRLLEGRHGPLHALQGQLMGMIVLPYLGATVASSECERPAPAPLLSPSPVSASPYRTRQDPLKDIPMRLTHRTALVLEAIAQAPGVSNRGAGERAGITDQGQISKLLARLQRLGLVENTGAGQTKGEPNAWTLTTLGGQVAQSIRIHTPNHEAVSP